MPATPSCSSVSDHFHFQPIQSTEVLSALKGLDTRKSAGPDGIPALFLHQVAEEIAEPLSYIYNHSLNTGTVPLAWKRSNITPVHKGGDFDNPGNFRPISVVPVMAKVLEKFISNQLGSFLVNHHLLNDLQGVYRHGRSTDHILLYAVDTITQALDAGNSVCAAFLDLRKAFDSLDHHVLLHRLLNLGVSGTELRWFTNYLSHRMQRVKCGGNVSEWGSVMGGILQGSALGPLLFLVYVNNMPLAVKHGCLLQFADDTCLICQGESPAIVGAHLNADLCLLSTWIHNSKMQFNLKKSSVMWFSVRSRYNGAQPQILIDNVPLSQVTKQKYLGVTFDNKLNWSSHVAATCRSMAYYLYQINHHSRSLPFNILKMLTESLVFSRLTYALPVWGPAVHQDSLLRLNRLHNRAVCICCGLHKSDHITNHRQTIGWLPVSLLIQHRTLCAMMEQYTGGGIQLNPPLQFGQLHTCNLDSCILMAPGVLNILPLFVDADPLLPNAIFDRKLPPGGTLYHIIYLIVCGLFILIFIIIYCLICSLCVCYLVK